jgi:hypothetical protein
MNLTDIYGIFHPVATQYKMFPIAYGTFSNIDHILEHKANLIFCVVLGLELRAFTLSHSTSAFCDGYFQDRVS